MTPREASTELNNILRSRIPMRPPFFGVAPQESTNELVLFFEPVIKWRILKFFRINSIDDDCVWEGYKIILKETGPPMLN